MLSLLSSLTIPVLHVILSLMKKTAIITISLLFILALSAEGAIYRYVDEKGVIHFTDSPPVKEARLVSRDSPRQRTSKRRIRRLSRGEMNSLAERKAREYGLSPELVKSVIEVESNWDPRARSRKGALGLMQLMPETAKELGVRNPFDPEANIDGGTRYLKYLIERFGDLELALAAYNAGPTVVEKYGMVPPIRETREYVRKILSRYQGGGTTTRIYRVILKDGTTMFTNSPIYLNNMRSF